MFKKLAYLPIWLSAIVCSAQIDDPIPEAIVPSGKILYLQDYAMIPSSANERPMARINLLREVDDESGRLFVNDLRGNFWSITDGEPSLFVDIKSEFSNFIDSPGFGTGFGAFDFHPEFADNGIFYTTHTEATGSGDADFGPFMSDGIIMQWVLTEWTLTDPALEAWQGEKREIIRFDYPGRIHGMQEIAFNPTAEMGDEDYGLLYVCLGDGGSSQSGFPENLRKKTSWLGTIFKIDPFGSNSSNGKYGIPESNPFVNDTIPEVIKEIYAYGFRNPHRISWDPIDGSKMYCGDIGESNIEEVNQVIAGGNYGWDSREGTFLYDVNISREVVFPLPANDSSFNYVYPVAQYDHDEGAAIVGGYVYRGSDMPQMEGEYIFGDIASGRLFHFNADESALGSQSQISLIGLRGSDGFGTSILSEISHNRADLRFGTDLNGEMYTLSKADGSIWRLRGSNPVAVNDLARQEVNWITPTPAKNFVEINTYLPFDADLEILSQSGQQVLQKSNLTDGSKIDVSSLVSGMYLARFSLGKNTYTQRVIIQK